MVIFYARLISSLALFLVRICVLLQRIGSRICFSMSAPVISQCFPLIATAVMIWHRKTTVRISGPKGRRFKSCHLDHLHDNFWHYRAIFVYFATFCKLLPAHTIPYRQHYRQHYEQHSASWLSWQLLFRPYKSLQRKIVLFPPIFIVFLYIFIVLHLSFSLPYKKPYTCEKYTPYPHIMLQLKKKYRVYIISVSYTHLDVYKRQG